MPEKIRITAIGGSLEPVSSTRILMDCSVNELIALGAEVRVFDVKDLKLPLYTYPVGGISVPEGFRELLSNVKASDGFLFASPEYHGTISGAYKNVMDYFEFLCNEVPPYISGKPVGLIAAAGAESAGSGTLNTMINIVHSLRGLVASGSLAIGSANRIVSSEEILNDSIKRKLRRLAEELYTLSAKLK